MSEDKSLLIVDDDAPFRQRLAQAMEKRGFVVVAAESVAAGIEAARARPPAYAVVDLKLADGNGLEVVKALREVRRRYPHRGPDRLCQYRHRRGGGEDRRGRLSRQARRCRCDPGRPPCHLPALCRRRRSSR